MSERCVICDHPRSAHVGSRCRTDSFLRGRCDCDFVELPALRASATPSQHRARAGWWQLRIEMAEARRRRARVGSERWSRLERFIDAARTARGHHLAMAGALTVAGIAATAAEPGDDLLDLVSIESIATQQPATFEAVVEQLVRTDTATRDAVRARLTAEFDGLEPRHRRELLERDALRGFLEHVGVVSAWRMSMPEEPSRPEPVDRQVLLESVEHELDGIIADEPWGRTAPPAGCRPRDQALIDEPQRSRDHVEAYWRHWAQAPSPQVLIAYIAMDPDEFKRYLALAADVLTPAERSRFRDRNQRNAWIVSGMQPLFREGREVPLDDVIEPGYLPATAF